jgi:hypothetical protein
MFFNFLQGAQFIQQEKNKSKNNSLTFECHKYTFNLVFKATLCTPFMGKFQVSS